MRAAPPDAAGDSATGTDAATRAARRAFWFAGLRLTAWFGVCFYGAEWWAARQTRWHQLGMAWEASIPWWPPAYLVYFSVLVAPFFVLLRVPDAQAVRAWERRMALAIALAFACFVLWPAQLSYPPPPADQLERWAWLRQLAQLIAGRHNLLPSLHVALSGITLFTLWPWTGPAARIGLSVWWLALMASILLTHQHHVADLLAGLLLALAVHHTFPSSPHRHTP